MTSRERVRIVLEHGIPDRVPMHDGYWDETLERWKSEGMPEEAASSREAAWDYFDTDIRLISVDTSFQFAETVLDEDQRYVTKRTKDGMIEKRIKGKTSTPGLMSFAVSSRDDWERLKSRLTNIENRLPANIDDLVDSFENSKKFVAVAVHDPYEASWSKIGPSRLLVFLKVDPDFVHDVFSTITDLNLMVCEELLGRGYSVDGAWIWGDIAYTRGLLFSPDIYKDLLLPYHRRLIGFFHQRGLPVIYHTDGNVEEVIPLLIQAGIDCLQPLECKAGMNLFKLKASYGEKLVFMGNVDFEKIAKGYKKAEEEIALKVGEGKMGGGYIYHSDHSVPPTISLDRYQEILSLVRKYGEY